MIRSRLSQFLILILCYGFVSACQPKPDVDAENIAKLASMLQGEFDSGNHMRRDKRNDVPKEQAHGWVNRNFIKVDAPDVGDTVLVGTTKYGGEKWVDDKYEFLVWTFKGDENSDGIIMSPRRFKDFIDRLPDGRDASKLAGFKPEDLETGESGAACEILWQPTETGFRGTTDPCQVMSTTHNIMLNWIWTFDADKDGLWISFRGEDEAGKVYDATPTDDPYRLNRLNGSLEYATGADIVFNTRDRAAYAEAIEYLKTAVVKEPENAKAHMALIYAYIKTNKYDEAAEVLEAVRPLKSTLSAIDQNSFDGFEARIVQDEPAEIEAWKKVLAATSKSRWAWWEMAIAHYRMENYQGVVDAIDQALLVEPNERAWDATRLPYIHSKAHFRLGNLDEAIKTAEPGIRNPDARRASFYRKAMALKASGQVEDPKDLFATYREYSARNGKVNESFYQANLALWYFELSDYENAVKHAEIGYNLTQSFYQTFVLGYSLTENGQPQAALDFFERDENDYPENLYFQAGKGWALYRLGRYEDAKAQYAKAKALGKRKNWAVERDIRAINVALENPDAPQVPPVRWFGD